MYLVASAATSWFLNRAMTCSGPGAKHVETPPPSSSSSSATDGADWHAPIFQKSTGAAFFSFLGKVEQRPFSLSSSACCFSLPSLLCARETEQKKRARESSTRKRQGPRSRSSRREAELSLQIEIESEFFLCPLISHFFFLREPLRFPCLSFIFSLFLPRHEGTGAFSLFSSGSGCLSRAWSSEREDARVPALVPLGPLPPRREDGRGATTTTIKKPDRSTAATVSRFERRQRNLSTAPSEALRADSPPSKGPSRCPTHLERAFSPMGNGRGCRRAAHERTHADRAWSTLPSALSFFENSHLLSHNKCDPRSLSPANRCSLPPFLRRAGARTAYEGRSSNGRRSERDMRD